MSRLTCGNARRRFPSMVAASVNRLRTAVLERIPRADGGGRHARAHPPPLFAIADELTNESGLVTPETVPALRALGGAATFGCPPGRWVRRLIDRRGGGPGGGGPGGGGGVGGGGPG